MPVIKSDQPLLINAKGKNKKCSIFSPLALRILRRRHGLIASLRVSDTTITTTNKPLPRPNNRNRTPNLIIHPLLLP
jgi:hypothetical protein